MKKHVETELEWQLKQATSIIEYIADKLYVEFPYMYKALHPSWLYGENEAGYAMATDGQKLLLPSVHVMDLFRKNEKFIARSYMHLILHCLYGHLWLRGNRAVKLFNVSCDIAVERAIDEIDKQYTKRILTWTRQSLYNEMSKKNIVSAAQIYELLLDKEPEYLASVEQEFYVDDHHIWPREEKKRAPIAGFSNQAEKKWQTIARQTKLGHDKSKKEIDSAIERFLASAKTKKRKMRYEDFLKKFVHPREEIKVNEEEFDLGYYSYGLNYFASQNRRIPMIEPLETVEDCKLKDFVIAIDTSASTSGELVKRFVKETVQLLLEDVYARDYKIYVIQADEAVRRVDIINEKLNLAQFFDKYEIVGGGNTDFRPVFSYVNKQVEEGQMKLPEGLLYFTDGEGKYPIQPPKMKTAFVYLGEYNRDLVPQWAIRHEPDIMSFLESKQS